MTFLKNVIPRYLHWLKQSVWLYQKKSYRVLFNDFPWHDIECHTVSFVKTFLVWHKNVIPCPSFKLSRVCVWLVPIWLKMSYQLLPNGFVWTSHAKRTLKAKENCHTAPGSMTFSKYVIPSLFLACLCFVMSFLS